MLYAISLPFAWCFIFFVIVACVLNFVQVISFFILQSMSMHFFFQQKNKNFFCWFLSLECVRRCASICSKEKYLEKCQLCTLNIYRKAIYVIAWISGTNIKMLRNCLIFLFSHLTDFVFVFPLSNMHRFPWSILPQSLCTCVWIWFIFVTASIGFYRFSVSSYFSVFVPTKFIVPFGMFMFTFLSYMHVE